MAAQPPQPRPVFTLVKGEECKALANLLGRGAYARARKQKMQVL